MAEAPIDPVVSKEPELEVGDETRRVLHEHIKSSTTGQLVSSEVARQRTRQWLAMTTRRAGPLDKYFYCFMSLLIAVVVVYGFSHTVDKNLIHPAVPRPFILYVHAAIFSGWVVFLIFQSALVRTHNVQLHRLTGWFGVALGVTIPVLGVSTAITMARFKILHFHSMSAASDLIISFFDMIAFTIPFALAIYWRKKPEFHRRLILIASCALTAAAFGRFPPQLLSPGFFYAGVDILILLGAVRDLVVNRRIHRVYRYALPAFIFGQTVVMYTDTHNSPYWLKISHAILG
jgi:Na+-transporting NADH:ubiquinone oxidoreductase subunit NqrE